MKKTAILMLLPLLLWACSDDNDYALSPAISVEQADVLFTSQGGQGQVSLSQVPTAIAVSEDWCQAEPQGTTLIVTASRWQGLESRNALITLTDQNGLQTHIAVHQDGAVWSLRGQDKYTVANDDASTLLIPMKIDFDYEVESSDDSWLTGTMTDEGYLVTLAENNTGARRRGTLTFSSEQGRRTYEFEQFGLRVVEGQYIATYYADPDYPQQMETKQVELTLIDSEKYRYRIDGLCPDRDIFAIMTYDPTTHDMQFTPGQQYPCGETTRDGKTLYGYGAMVGFYKNDGSVWATYTPFQQDYPCTMNEQTGKPTWHFIDNETWSAFTQIGFRIDLIINQVPADYNYVGTVAQVYNLTLRKL